MIHRHRHVGPALVLALLLPFAAASARVVPAGADSSAAALADTAAVDTALAWSDTSQAWPDSVPTLPGIDWSLVTGAQTDSLLLAGKGVVLAFEDTFAFDPGSVDTMLVAAQRVTIGEVIEAIGRRMEQESRRMRDAEFTTLTTVVERDEPGRRGDDYTVTETAERHHVSDDAGEQSARLWERVRKVKDGVVVKETIEDKPKTDWRDMQQQMLDALPFSRGSGNRYRYTITGRELVGNDLIYRIDFAPKSRFEALPSGTVWVDYSHWVIRRLEARMTDVVPFPLFVEAVPVFRLSRERFGEYWFTTDAYLELDLKDVPLVGNPRTIEVRVQLRDVVINGLARTSASRPPRRQRLGNLDPDQFWMSEEASDDSLDAYWQRIAGVWDSEMSPELAPVALSPERVDSLTVVGDRLLDRMERTNPWTLTLRPLQVPGFNRVQGPVLRLGANVRRQRPGASAPGSAGGLRLRQRASRVRGRPAVAAGPRPGHAHARRPAARARGAGPGSFGLEAGEPVRRRRPPGRPRSLGLLLGRRSQPLLRIPRRRGPAAAAGRPRPRSVGPSGLRRGAGPGPDHHLERPGPPAAARRQPGRPAPGRSPGGRGPGLARRPGEPGRRRHLAPGRGAGLRRHGGAPRAGGVGHGGPAGRLGQPVGAEGVGPRPGRPGAPAVAHLAGGLRHAAGLPRRRAGRRRRPPGRPWTCAWAWTRSARWGCRC